MAVFAKLCSLFTTKQEVSFEQVASLDAQGFINEEQQGLVLCYSPSKWVRSSVFIVRRSQRCFIIDPEQQLVLNTYEQFLHPS